MIILTEKQHQKMQRDFCKEIDELKNQIDLKDCEIRNLDYRLNQCYQENEFLIEKYVRPEQEEKIKQQPYKIIPSFCNHDLNTELNYALQKQKVSLYPTKYMDGKIIKHDTAWEDVGTFKTKEMAQEVLNEME